MSASTATIRNRAQRPAARRKMPSHDQLMFGADREEVEAEAQGRDAAGAAATAEGPGMTTERFERGRGDVEFYDRERGMIWVRKDSPTYRRVEGARRPGED